MVELSFELCAWKPFYRALRIVQGESDSRSFVIQLRDNQNPVNLAGSQAKLFVRKPDKKVVWQDCTIVDASKGIIQVTLKSQVAAVSGTATCWIQVYRPTGEDLRFGGIRLEVEEGDIAGAIESTNEFAELLLAIRNANDTAQRLTQAKENGEFNGCYFTPKVEQLSDTDVKFSFVPSEAGVPAPSSVIVKLAAGTGGSSVAWKQPDFNQNDPDELDYIKNRTHWEEQRVLDVEWYGNTVGRRTYTDALGTVYYQVSTVCPEADDIVGAVIELSNGTKITVSKKLFSEFGSDGLARIGSYLYAIQRPLSVGAPALPDQGTVGLYASVSGGVYPARFSNSRTIVHPLDEKFIPDSIARKTDMENLGNNGGYYTPVVSQPTDDTMKVEFVPSEATMPAVAPVTVQLPVPSESNGAGEHPDNPVVDGITVGGENGVRFDSEGKPSAPILALYGAQGDEPVRVSHVATAQEDGEAVPLGQVKELIRNQDSGQNTTHKEVVTTVTVGSDPVVLDSTAPEQAVNLVWAVDNARTIPAFTNYYNAKSGMTYPRAFDTAQYVQFFAPTYHGNEAAFVAGHTYFHAMKYRMDGDSTATLQGGSFRTPTGSSTISGSGWVYGISEPVGVSSTSFILNKTNTGTGVIEYVYCIDITALNESGTTTPTKLAELAELFGELPLVPGEDYPGGTIGDGTATMSINRGGEITAVDNSSATATVKGGDVLSVDGGSVAFMCKVLKTVAAGDSKEWEGVVVVNGGDSLTDPEINADRKYPDLIAEKQGNTVVNMGKGGTGYWRGHEDGNAFYQRMANVPSNADVVTVFGSINDWRITLEGVEIGTASDTIEAGTLAGYINECVNAIQAKAPYAQIALITAMPYHGIREDIQESLANIIVEVARYRKIKCLDLYHESGFRVDDPVFAQVYCTDYSATADTYGHPSNLAHKRIIAPEFMKLLRRMIL